MRIVFLGSGSVATHMSIALREAGHEILQIYSPNIKNARILSQQLNCEATDQLNHLCSWADLYVIAVKDNAIASVLNQLTPNNAIWVHTAGSISMNIFEKFGKKYGVFYPLQTFSKVKEVDFKNVPLCLEAVDEHVLLVLEKLAKSISRQVYSIPEKQRQIIHVSAAFACNFVNFLYTNAHKLLEENDIAFEIIRPLILETAQKVMYNSPRNVQTGPAVRNDTETMSKHQELLKNNDELLSIYNTLSSQIIDLYK